MHKMKYEKHSVFTQALADVYIAKMLDEIDSTPVIPHEFSPEFEKKTQKLIKKRKKPYYALISTAGRRAACISAAVLITLGATMSVGAVRVKVADLVRKYFPDYDEISVSSYSSEHFPESIEHEYTISVPEGFVPDAEWDYRSDNYIDRRYTKGEKYIIFRQHIINEDIDVYVDGNTLKKEYYTGENNVLYTIYHKKDKAAIVFWENNGYFFEVISNLEKDEVIDMCVNIV